MCQRWYVWGQQSTESVVLLSTTTTTRVFVSSGAYYLHLLEASFVIDTFRYLSLT